MKPFPIQRRPDDSCYLHTWRVGAIYYGQNREITLKEWTNLIHRNHCHHRNPDGIPVWDSRRGLPYPVGAFDAIYSCHVIEHLTRRRGVDYVSDLFNHLKPGGICRISTPDLELQARTYVACLDGCLKDPVDTGRYNRLDLATSGLIDQLCRTEGGGELLRYFREEEVDYGLAEKLYGAVYREFLPAEAKQADWGIKKSVKRSRSPAALFDRLKLKIRKMLGGVPPHATGEVELWVWDQCSLKTVMEKAGFTDVKLHTHESSGIADWDHYRFDTYKKDGKTALELSLILEARRPGE